MTNSTTIDPALYWTGVGFSIVAALVVLLFLYYKIFHKVIGACCCCVQFICFLGATTLAIGFFVAYQDYADEINQNIKKAEMLVG